MSDAIEVVRRVICENHLSVSDGHYRRVAQACIAAYLAEREAQGFVMVPVEPTPRMRLAGSRADNDAQCSPFHIPPEQSSLMVYAAMIAAATPPTT